MVLLLSNCNFLFQLYGYTPLHMACLYDQTRVVAELLKKLKTELNAVNAKDNVSTTIILCAQCLCEYNIKFAVGVDSSSSRCKKWSA